MILHYRWWEFWSHDTDVFTSISQSTAKILGFQPMPPFIFPLQSLQVKRCLYVYTAQLLCFILIESNSRLPVPHLYGFHCISL